MDKLFSLVSVANEAIWSYCALWLLVGSAPFFFFRLRLYRLFRPSIIRKTFQPTSKGGGGGKGDIKPFNAFCMSLASCVGTGNLAGVATAICVGGPGAMFWMCVMAVFASALSFAECSLAQLYKRKGKGCFYGGPAYYMTQGLKWAPMGAAFAVATAFNQGMMSHIVQSKVICDAVGGAFGIDGSRIAIILATALAFIAFGGVRRVATFSSVIVPVMSVGYLVLAFCVIVTHLGELPDMFALVIKSAFGWEEAAGGTVGMAIMHGARRGIFSNEAGEGSSPNAAATAHVGHPATQGLLHVFGVFVDTLVICSATATIILLSGVDFRAEDGIILTAHAFKAHFGVLGGWFLTVVILLFAFSTIAGNYFYGETNIRYLTSSGKWLTLYRILSSLMVLAGGYVSLGQAWSAVDFAVALMVIMNMTALWLMYGKVSRLIEDFIARHRRGDEIVLDPDMFPGEVLEGWKK